MNILSLLTHTSEILKISLKNSSPIDKIVASFLHKKKYIGSNDRKFISELLFATLRTINLIKFCTKNLNKYNDILKIIFPQNTYENTLLLALCVLSEYHIGNEIEFSPQKLLHFNYNSNLSFTEIFTNTIYEKFNIEKNKIIDLTNQILINFNEINEQILKFYSNKKNKGNVNKMDQNQIKLISIRYSFNEFLTNKINIYNKCNETNFLINFTKAFLKPAKVSLRVNTSKIPRNILLELFNQNNISASPSTISPFGIYLEQRQNIISTDYYKKGFIEIQDEGSQLIPIILDAQENSLVLDACAGAGGKSLQIADLTQNKALIFATDIEYLKLKQIHIRAKRQGFSNIRTYTVPNKINQPKEILKKYPDLPREFDYVLVDVPCSGTGTARRSPMHKYNIDENKLRRLTINQLRILNFYSKFVRIGGIIVYSTCSIIKDENQDIIEQFLSENENFKASPILPILKKYKISLPEINNNDFMLNLFPHIHNTDGFFIARMIRTY